MRKLFFFPTQLYCQRLNQRQIGAYSLPTNVLYKYTHCTVHKCTVYVCSKARLWIRINFLQIRIQFFFSMQIRIQSLQICEILPYKSFLELSNTKKLSKYKKYGACLIDCKKCNKSQLSPIFLHFPDPGGKMIADPCVSGSTALQQGILKQ